MSLAFNRAGAATARGRGLGAALSGLALGRPPLSGCGLPPISPRIGMEARCTWRRRARRRAPRRVRSSKVTPIACEKLPNVPGKSLTTLLVEYPPNAFTPRHRHPGSVMAFVLKGKIRSQLGGGPAEVFGVGQSWFEPPGTIHLFAENASATEPATLLAHLRRR